MLPFNGENKISQSFVEAASKVIGSTPKPKDFWDGISDIDSSKSLGLGPAGQIQQREINEDKIDDMIEKLFSSKIADELSGAWSDGDEKEATKILKSAKVKGGDLKGIVKRLFGEEFQSILTTIDEEISIDGRTRGFKAAAKRIEAFRTKLLAKQAALAEVEEEEDEEDTIEEAMDKNLEQNLKNDNKQLRVWDNDTSRILITGSSMEVLKKKMKLSSGEINSIIDDLVNRGGSGSEYKGKDVTIEVNESAIGVRPEQLEEATVKRGDKNTTDLNPLISTYQDGFLTGHLNLLTFMHISIMDTKDQKKLADMVIKKGAKKKVDVPSSMLKGWRKSYEDSDMKVPEVKLEIALSQHHERAVKEKNESILDIAKLNEHIVNLVKSIDEGKDVDFLSRGRVLNTLSQAGIAWDRSLLERKHLEVLGINEAKSYEIYHRSFSDAVEEVIQFLKSKGYTMSDDDIWDNISTGPKKPSKGKTNKYSIPLLKGDKETKKVVQFQVYGLDGKGNDHFELNMYIG